MPDGRPALLVHCSLAHGGVWARMVEALRSPLHALAVDLPGHGRAPDWDGKSDYHSGATARARELLRVPALVIGHSFGATVALRLALERPDLVTGLVLIEPVLFAAVAGTPAYRAHVGAEAAGHAALAVGDHLGAARAFLARWGDATPWETLPRATRGHLAARMFLIEAARPALYADSSGLLLPGRLEALDKPVLLMAGDRSPVVVHEIVEALAARLKSSNNAVIAGAGHMLPLTHPAETAGVIDAWLEETALAGSGI